MTVKTDDFERSDENPIDGNWETLGASGLALASGVLQGGGDLCLSGYTTSAFEFLPNHGSYIEILTPGANDRGGVGVRCAAGRGYVVYYEEGDGRAYLVKKASNVDTVLIAPEVTLVSGDELGLVATTAGANCDLEIFINRVSVGTYSDTSSPYTDGQPAVAYQRDNSNVTKLDNWSGEDSSSSTAYTLSAELGNYVLTGQSALLRAGGFITAESGNYSLLGSAASRDVEMNAEQGEYDLNGQDAVLIGTSILVAESGTYSLIGQATNLLYSFAASIARPKGQRRMYGFRLNR